MDDDYLIQADGIFKKYCGSLKRSIVYTVQDVASDCLGLSVAGDSLRPEEFWSLSDVGFTLRKGECLGIAGGNGAGKSTLLKIISGIFNSDLGSISLLGRVGALIEVGAGFHPMLIGRENIYINAAILGFTKSEVDEKLDDIIEFSELGDAIDMPVKTYSSGMHVRLGFSIVVCLEPEILLLDEVLAVGDIRFAQKCISKIRELLNKGVGVVFVSHSINDMLRVCDRVLVLEKGIKVFEGGTEQGLVEYQKTLHINKIDDVSSKFIKRVVVGVKEDLVCGVVKTGENILITVFLNEGFPELVNLKIVFDSPIYGHIAMIREDLTLVQGSLKENKVTITVAEIPLLRGSYQLHAHLYSVPDGVYLGGCSSVTSFDVDSSDMQGDYRHLVALRSHWEVETIKS